MFKIDEDMSIHVTRGDAITFGIMATFEGEPSPFVKDDVVRLKVFAKKSCEDVVLEKDVIVANQTETVTISLSGEDTKLADVINKPTDFWYEVELNPDTRPQTIIGYDENGAKVFRLYPEGGDIA